MGEKSSEDQIFDKHFGTHEAMAEEVGVHYISDEGLENAWEEMSSPIKVKIIDAITEHYAGETYKPDQQALHEARMAELQRWRDKEAGA